MITTDPQSSDLLWPDPISFRVGKDVWTFTLVWVRENGGVGQEVRVERNGRPLRAHVLWGLLKGVHKRFM